MGLIITSLSALESDHSLIRVWAMVCVWVWTMVWSRSDQKTFGLKSPIRDLLCLESRIRGILGLESLIRVNFRLESLIRDNFGLESLIRQKFVSGPQTGNCIIRYSVDYLCHSWDSVRANYSAWLCNILFRSEYTKQYLVERIEELSW